MRARERGKAARDEMEIVTQPTGSDALFSAESSHADDESDTAETDEQDIADYA